MAHLGSLSPDVTVEDLDDVEELDTFEWFGDVFSIAGNLSALGIMRYAHDLRQAEQMERVAAIQVRQARTVDQRQTAEEKLGDAAAMQLAAAYNFLRGVLAPGQWDRFEEVTNLAGCDETTLGGLIEHLVAAITARPTKQPSGSAGGRSKSGTGSRGRSRKLTPKEQQEAELFHQAPAR